MFFAISAHNGVPIYEQIVRQVKFAVAGGLLAPGELVPSVRELARELTINPNTVARAYRELQAEGILETVRGTGLEIAAGAGRLCADERLKLVRARLKDVFREARQSRLDAKQIRVLVERELSALEREGNES
jgi:GntR family transcriptional regulator